MLSTEDRINLRNELFDKLFKLKVITIPNFQKLYKITRLFKLKNVLENDIDLQTKYYTYVSEFRSEEEAKYCLLHKDDFTNHICPICGNICEFYINLKRNHYEYRSTCGNLNCINAILHSEESKKKARDSMTNRHGAPYTMQSKKLLQTWQNNYHQNNKQKEEYLNKTALYVVDQIKSIFCKNNIEKYEIYYNDDYFYTFVKLFFIHENRLLTQKEIGKIFERNGSVIKEKAKKLNLLDCFIVVESKLELILKKLLVNNNFIEGKNNDFHRNDRSILPHNEYTRRSYEIDFVLSNYNIGFEINDLNGHSIGRQDIDYHYNKTIQCLQRNFRLIHLWEWELVNKTYWSKISQWILHLLNQNKIQLNIKECFIKEVYNEEKTDFLNQYSITSYQESDVCIGLYHNDELIQILSFKDNMLSICIKFGYNIIEGTINIINAYKQYKQLSSVISYCDLSKFTGKTFENIGFKLTGYVEPSIISKDSNEFYDCRKVYNCGYNVYMLTK